MSFINKWPVLLVLIFSLFSVSAEEKIPEVIVSTTAQFTTQDDQNYLAVTLSNHKGWHTYWKNPGDAGLPISFKFQSSGEDLVLEPMQWPVPKRYIEKGNMLAYGYSNEKSFFFKLPDNIKPQLTIQAHWLVCKHICIPGKVELTGSINNGKYTLDNPQDYTISQEKISTSFSNLPQPVEFPFDLDLVLAKTHNSDVNKLTLYYNMSGVSNSDIKKHMSLLTPFPATPFTFKREKLFLDKKKNLYAKFNIEWDGEYEEPEITFPADGKFDKPYTLKFLYANPKTNKVEIISKTFSSFLNDATRLENFFNIVKPTEVLNQAEDSSPTVVAEISKAQKSFFFYILFAFIGGIILNFMPCVLPVISIKLFGLIKHKNAARKTIFKHNLFYSLGVMATFVLMAFAIFSLKSAGEFVGWGFQLQSPIFVALMSLVIFIFSLNMFGLFEFSTPGGNKLGSMYVKDGFMGDFLSGVLATILATPCSAPFLGTALTFAFTSSNLELFTIFMCIGLGLSFPFILTGIFPKLIFMLPKPGAWMENLKKLLGLSLLLTVIWLLDVFSALTDTTSGTLYLNVSLLMVFFLIYMRTHMTKRKRYTLPVIAMTIYILFNMINVISTQNVTVSASDGAQTHQSMGMTWKKWSIEEHTKLMGEKRLTFIDFTAKWCFTCKVNERLVINTDEFKTLIKDKGVTLMLADWTKRDPIIGNWLKHQGLAGVPAYFVINSNGDLINLGETISISKIKEVLK